MERQWIKGNVHKFQVTRPTPKVFYRVLWYLVDEDGNTIIQRYRKLNEPMPESLNIF